MRGIANRNIVMFLPARIKLAKCIQNPHRRPHHYHSLAICVKRAKFPPGQNARFAQINVAHNNCKLQFTIATIETRYSNKLFWKAFAPKRMYINTYRYCFLHIRENKTKSRILRSTTENYNCNMVETIRC